MAFLIFSLAHSLPWTIRGLNEPVLPLTLLSIYVKLFHIKDEERKEVEREEATGSQCVCVCVESSPRPTPFTPRGDLGLLFFVKLSTRLWPRRLFSLFCFWPSLSSPVRLFFSPRPEVGWSTAGVPGWGIFFFLLLLFLLLLSHSHNTLVFSYSGYSSLPLAGLDSFFSTTL